MIQNDGRKEKGNLKNKKQVENRKGKARKENKVE